MKLLEKIQSFKLWVEFKIRKYKIFCIIMIYFLKNIDYIFKYVVYNNKILTLKIKD